MEKKPFNKKKLREVLNKAYTFVTNIEKCFPTVREEAEDVLADKDEDTAKSKRIIKPGINVKQRLRSLSEIQEKLEEIKGKRLKSIHENMYKKNLKTRLTKQQRKEKKKQEKRSKKNKTLLKKGDNNTVEKPKNDLDDKENSSTVEKPENGLDDNNKQHTSNKIVFNKDSKMVFNRIDFSGVENDSFDRKRKKKKQERDPKLLLDNLKKSKLKLNELEESGETQKAKEIKEKQMWMSALKRSEGVKVKDDETLLKRTIRKQKSLKKRNKKKWDTRVQAVEKKKEERQKKREDNIAAKQKERKSKKIKRSIKKGRVVL